MKKEELTRLFSGRVRRILEGMDLDFQKIHEIRLRTGAPLQMICGGKEFFPDENGRASREGGGVCMTERDLRETMEYIGNYSLYAYEDEIRQGYLTIQGGHRVGIAGKTVMEEGKVKGDQPYFLHQSADRPQCGGVRGPGNAFSVGPGRILPHPDRVRPPLRKDDAAPGYYPPGFRRERGTQGPYGRGGG